MRTFGKTLLSPAKLVEPHTGPDPTHVHSTILVFVQQPDGSGRESGRMIRHAGA
ncbi:hypothetical protein KPSA1_06278 [Pseudomonas syringae pv. actinidiae]|uniref:Uncharacterized protein n=1 Tax=Pseudomonas syringae pv. actinidiae TaxID=103796 RepID=A0A2V0QIU6_PSESF|nr:hypothetical protein KPSA1_06278 [Pseudomonas syringae pv. actinidiae]GBH19929.1 hypothetical protein KPSA3_05948 [Pseudomonas syringae pv. actinidiae]